MKDPGPQREEYETFEEWSINRHHWKAIRDKHDRLYPFLSLTTASLGEDNPIPIKRERGGRDS